jgi:gas vesicle protein
MSEDNGNNIFSFLAGFVFGGLVGAIAALIMAPQSGEETRLMIRDKSIELKDMATSTASEISRVSQEKATELQKQGQLILEEQKGRIAKAVDEATDEPEEESFTEVDVVEEVPED